MKKIFYFFLFISLGLSKYSWAQNMVAGSYHSLFICEDGTARSIGRNNVGQLGDGTINNSSIPVNVKNLFNLIEISGNGVSGGPEQHSIALKSDGTVWAWGGNLFGQLGDNSFIERHIPVKVFGLTNVISIAAGATHSLALKSDGTLWAWGGNDYGQLGNGNYMNKKIPVQVTGLTGYFP